MKEWLVKKGAFPAEIEIFIILHKIHIKRSASVRVSEIRKLHGSNRQNVHRHIVNLIRKGIVKREGGRAYLPVKVWK